MYAIKYGVVALFIIIKELFHCPIAIMYEAGIGEDDDCRFLHVCMPS